MLLFTALYIVVFTLYAVFWQKRESEHVREKLVEDFYEKVEKEPKNPDVQFGGVVYVMKNMDSPAGRAARRAFRAQRMNELAIAGIILVAAPVGIVVSIMNGEL